METPSYYQGNIDCWDVLQEVLTPSEMYAFCLGNAIKYLYRCNFKHRQPVEDLLKCKDYIDRAIKIREESEINVYRDN